MYVLVWTPNYCGVPHKLETFSDHDKMAARLKEIDESKYEDVDWKLYIGMGMEDDGISDYDLTLILDYNTKMSAMELYIDPKWYGGRDYQGENIKEARMGKILMKYIDRLNDPVEDAGDGSYHDSLENIVKEMSLDVDKEQELQRG